MKLLIPFDPCLISMFDFQRFTRPETVGSLAGAHIPSVLDVQTPSIRFSAARALTLRRTQRVFLNVSTFILYLLYPSPIQDYFTDVLSKQTPSFCFKVKNVYIAITPWRVSRPTRRKLNLSGRNWQHSLLENPKII